eukprot:snap_masked-scaffold_15-processed-gene-6.25-mRNA-1 protein AED:1.00 eAED:1.00 QI:0/0/0/0/1/1/2/0/64
MVSTTLKFSSLELQNLILNALTGYVFLLSTDHFLKNPVDYNSQRLKVYSTPGPLIFWLEKMQKL